jgi:hypothetical protein
MKPKVINANRSINLFPGRIYVFFTENSPEYSSFVIKMSCLKVNWFKLFSKSRDPVIILPRKAMENIFRYLSGREILKLSTINKAWYKFIANSPVCMDKIRIQISEYFLTQKRVFHVSDILRILQGGRKYKHLSIACLESYMTKTQQFSPEHKLLMGCYRWKSITLCNHRFTDEIEFVNFLGFIEPFVEEVELRSVKIENFLGVSGTNFEFPKLKSLLLVNVSNFVYEEPFKNVYKLEDFAVATEQFLPSHIDHSDEIRARTESIVKILLNNQHIKHLQMFLEQKDFDCMFVRRNFLSSIQFKLCSLMVGRFRKLRKENSNHFQLKNFGKFLQLHEKTLTEVVVPESLGKEILEIVMNSMKSLKILTINNADSPDHNESFADVLEFVPNHSVENLNIRSKSSKFTTFVSAFIRNLPQLKAFNTGIVNQHIFDLLLENSSILESINVDFFMAQSPPSNSKLQNLKNMSITVKSDDNFRENIEKKAELTHFDELFLTATKRLSQKRDVNYRGFYEW